MTGCPPPFPLLCFSPGRNIPNWNWNFIARQEFTAILFLLSLCRYLSGGGHHRNMKSMPKIEIQKTENRKQRKTQRKRPAKSKSCAHTHFCLPFSVAFLSVLCPKAKMEWKPEIELKHGTEIPWLTRHNYIFMDKFLCLCNTLTMLTMMMMLLLLITTTSMMAWFAASKASINR